MSAERKVAKKLLELALAVNPCNACGNKACDLAREVLEAANYMHVNDRWVQGWVCADCLKDFGTRAKLVKHQRQGCVVPK